MSLPTYLFTDIEVVGRDDAMRYVKADSRLKDEAKIAASIAERQGELGLDPNGSRIVVLGFWASTESAPRTIACQTEVQEINALLEYWRVWNALRKADFDAKIVGYVCRTFDMLHLIRRSQLLGVPCPRVRLNRYGAGDCEDLFETLTFYGEQKTAIVPRTLDNMVELFRITGLPADPYCGADVPALFTAGNWDAIVRHCVSDLHKTRALAERLGVIDSAPAPKRKLTNLDLMETPL